MSTNILNKKSLQKNQKIFKNFLKTIWKKKKNWKFEIFEKTKLKMFGKKSDKSFWEKRFKKRN